jgi:site-specific DNA-methyltransferase (cytosine-N4-specific)
MRTPYWSDAAAALYVGDAREVLAEMPGRAVDCIVTSPPFWGKRDYGVPGQYGLESTPEEYVQHLRDVFTEARRVLADHGTAWLNLGDCFAGSWGNYVADGSASSRQADDPRRVARFGSFRPPQSRLRPKDLVGLPWRVAFALQQDGWFIRNAVIWAKRNAMPESVRDRLSTRYEVIFLLVKQPRYWFDLDAIRVPYTGDRALSRRAHHNGNRPHTIRTTWPPHGNAGDREENRRQRRHPAMAGTSMAGTFSERHAVPAPVGRNPGDVWSISTRPFHQAHFAVFPIDVPLRCIAAGCRPGGTVLDMFAGAATTGLAARRLERSFLGVELNASYAELAAARLTEERTRLSQEPR